MIAGWLLALLSLWPVAGRAEGEAPAAALPGPLSGMLGGRFGGPAVLASFGGDRDLGVSQLFGLEADTALATPTGPDWPGLWRDTAYFMGYQFVGIAFLYVLPERITNWTEEDKEEYSFSQWRENVTHPRWDPDDWWINYVLHPYWGAAYFVRGQERGLDGAQAFVYSTLLSSLYEFGPEALFEQPSIQDLIVTPVLGSILGRYFMSVRETIQRRADTPQPGDALILVLTDPLGAANALVDDLFGVNAQLTFGLSTPAALLHADEHQTDHERRALQQVVSAQDTVWALELRIPW